MSVFDPVYSVLYRVGKRLYDSLKGGLPFAIAAGVAYYLLIIVGPEAVLIVIAGMLAQALWDLYDEIMENRHWLRDVEYYLEEQSGYEPPRRKRNRRNND